MSLTHRLGPKAPPLRRLRATAANEREDRGASPSAFQVVSARSTVTKRGACGERSRNEPGKAMPGCAVAMAAAVVTATQKRRLTCYRDAGGCRRSRRRQARRSRKRARRVAPEREQDDGGRTAAPGQRIAVASRQTAVSEANRRAREPRSERSERRGEGYPPEGTRPRSGLGREARSRSDACKIEKRIGGTEAMVAALSEGAEPVNRECGIEQLSLARFELTS